MKGVKLYAVCYVTGYTSEAEVVLFADREDAEKEFDKLIRSTFGNWLDYMDWDNDNYSYPKILDTDWEELSNKDIYINTQYDITWDGFEVYERVYIQELTVN